MNKMGLVSKVVIFVCAACFFAVPGFADEYHWLEVEYADSLVSPFETAADGSASETETLLVPEGIGRYYSGPGPGLATFEVTITEPGDYVLWGRTIAPDVSSDSFYVEIDSGGDNVWYVELGTDWGWDQVNDTPNSVDPVMFSLPAGTHTIKFKHREDGTKLDKILLTNNLSYVPVGLGDPAENIPQVPLAPSSLSAALNGTDVDLTWTDNAVDEQGFNVYRKLDTDVDFALLQVISQADQTSYTDTSAVAGNTYEYQVRAYNAAGESAASNVSNPVSIPGVSSEYHWLEAEYADSLVSPFETAADGSASEGEGVQVPEGSGRYYSGPGPGLATFEVTITEPGDYVLWGRTIAPDGSSDSFYVEIDSSGDNAWFLELGTSWAWDQVSDSVTSADPVIFNLSAGTHTIKFKHREDGTKLDKILLTNDTNYVPTGLGDPAENIPQPPAAPSSLSAALNGTDVDLTWTDNAVDEQGFNVYRKLDTDVDFGLLQVISQADQTSYTDTSAVAGNTYEYQVTAYNAAGESAASNVSNAVYIPGAPGSEYHWLEVEHADTLVSPFTVITDGSASEGEGVQVPEGSGAYLSSPGPGLATFQVTITEPGDYVLWGRGIALDFNGDSFYVEIDSGGDNVWYVEHGVSWGWDQVNDAPNSIDPVMFNLPAGTHTIKFKHREERVKLDKILLTNDTNYVPSGLGDPAENIPQPPAAPSSLSAALNGTDVDLTWTDNAVDEQGFNVYRKLDTDADFGLLQVISQADQTSYTDTSAVAGNTYEYQVTAYKNGSESAASNVSNAVYVPGAPGSEYHWLEAEYADSLVSPFETAADGSASEGEGVQVPEGSGRYYSGPGPGLATFEVTITEPGDYVLWGRTIAPDGSSDSFYVEIDSSGDNAWFLELGTSWAWDQVSDSVTSADPVIFNLSAGTHTIKFKHREDGTKLDKILLTNDTNYVPTGLGDPAENIPQPPAAPSSLSAALNGTDVDLTWTDNAVDEQGFNVYRKLDTDVDFALLQVISQADQTSYTDTSAVAGNTYEYQVTAYNAAGESAASNVSNAVYIPGAPGSEYHWLEVEHADTLVSPFTVITDGSASEGEGVQVPEGSGAYLSSPGPGLATFQVTITEPGDYVLWGRGIALDFNGDSFYVEIDSGGDNVWYVEHGVSWGWDQVNDAPNSIDPVMFNLPAGTHTIKFKHREERVKLDKILLTNDTNYVPSGLGDPAENIPQPPAAPSSLSAALNGTDVDLTWTDNAVDEQGFNVYRKLDTDADFGLLQVISQADQTSYTDTSAVAGNTYEYQVTAYKNGSESAASNVSNAVYVPGAPGSEYHWLEAEYADSLVSPFETAADGSASEGEGVQVPEGSGRYYSGPGPGLATFQVTITEPGDYVLWGRTIAPDGSSDSFYVEIDSSGDNAWFLELGTSWAWDQVSDSVTSADPVIFNLSAGTHTIKFKHREDGTKLDKILLTNDTNYVPTGLGDPAENIPQPPAAPSSLSAALNGTDVDLTWTDNAVDEQGFNVYRKLDTDVDFALLQVISQADQTSYTDTSAVAGNTYEYQVTAYNAAGESAASNVSNAVYIPGAPGSEYHWLEVEHADTLVSPFTVITDGSASEGEGVQVPEGSGAYLSSPGPGLATFQVTITEPGDYVLWGRGIALDFNGDSFYVEIDSGGDNVWYVEHGVSWGWDQVNDAPNSIDPVMFNLPAGTHTIKFKHREERVKLDKILLTNDTNYVPSGLGDPAENIPQPPAAPSSLSAALNGTDVDLTWTDNAVDEQGFNVYRKLDTDADFGLLQVISQADQTSYTDTSAVAGNTYEYQVTAYKNGSESAASNVSNAVYVPGAPGSEYHWLEAEYADSLVSPFETAADGSASEGEGVQVPEGIGRYYGSPGPGALTLEVHIVEAGDYVLWGRTIAPDGSSDSFYVEIDSGGNNVWSVALGTNWGWDQVNDALGSVDPVVFNLTAGTHTIKFKHREDGVKLDKILLTNDQGFIPSGVGNPAENLPEPPQTGDEMHWLEAEYVDTIETKFMIHNSGDSSQESFLWMPDDAGTHYEAPGPGLATYVVNITEAGQYILWGRTIAPSGSDDSFFVEMDNTGDQKWIIEESTSWMWDKVNDMDSVADPVFFTLDVGVHRIKVKQREDGPKLDKLLLTNDHAFIPSAQGFSAENIPMSAFFRILALGDSITGADAARYSYRYNFWQKMIDGGWNFDMVGNEIYNKDQSNPGWPDYQNRSFDRNHEGHWGWRTDQILAALPTWRQQYTPDAALIHLGTNDAFQEQAASSTETYLENIIDELRADNPYVTVFLCTLIPVEDVDDNVRIDAINALISGIISRKTTTQSPVLLVDQNADFDATAGVDTYDGVHPNASGEEKIAQKFYDAFMLHFSTAGSLPPTGLAGAVVGGTDIELTWTDNADNEEGFYIYRKLTSEADFAGVHATISVPDTESWLDTEVTAGNSYDYKVTSFNWVAESNAAGPVTVDFSLSTTDYTQDADCIAAYLFEGSANDSSGVINYHHGTVLNGTATATGKFGDAYAFDGVDDNIEISDHNDFTPLNEMTVMAWVKIPADLADGEFNGVVSHFWGEDIAGSSIFERSWALSLYGTNGKNVVQGTLSNDGIFQAAFTTVGSTDIAPNTWYHIALRWDNNGNVDVIVNGNVDGTASGTPAFLHNSTEKIAVGNTFYPNGNLDQALLSLTGSIDEVGVFRRALTSTEIQDIMTYGLDGTN